MPQATSNDPRPALLFVPDISGFTQFVKSTDIDHGRHIIEELLEGLIESNELGLEVSEVEGDAVLFYRFGDPPDAGEFFHQVRRMFVDFHSRLRVYETRRICDCGACSTMHSLTLKIVAHFGVITQSQIKQHRKLFGSDVILIHRLLKNDISHHEYALFTRGLAARWHVSAQPDWASTEEGSHTYDVGEVLYRYVALAPLCESVPEPVAENFSIPGVTKQVFSINQEIRAPLQLVVDVATDLPQRLYWMQGAKRVEMRDHQPNHVGTKHRCVIDENSPVMVTTKYEETGSTVTLTETDEKRTMCSVYTFRRDGENNTTVQIDGFIKNNVLLKTLFALLLRRKLTTLFQRSAENLKHYCEEKYGRGEQ